MPTGHYRFRRSLGNVGSRFRGARPDTYPLYTGVLDSYPGAAAAYSLRALSRGWLAGDVVEVRRSSDSATQSFTANEVANGTLEAFCGVADGYVSTWYDQSGNANDATQIATASQPKIVDAGVLVVGGIDFDGVDDSMDLTSALTIDPSASGFASFISCAFDKNATGASQVFIRNSNLNPKHQIAFNTNGKYRYNLNDGTNNLFADTASDYGDNSLRLFSTTITGQSSTGLTHFVNGTQDSQHDTSLIGDTGASIDQISWASFPFGGSVKELILYPSDQSANRVGIETNINDHYSIYA